MAEEYPFEELKSKDIGLVLKLGIEAYKDYKKCQEIRDKRRYGGILATLISPEPGAVFTTFVTSAAAPTSSNLRQDVKLTELKSQKRKAFWMILILMDEDAGLEHVPKDEQRHRT